MTQAVVLSKQQAESLTGRIREAGESFGTLLLEAHEGEAWRAMGYATWQDYIAGEFTFTRGESYKLLTQARVSRAAGEPVSVHEAERVSRVIHVNEITSDSQPSEAVQRALAEQRESRAIPKPAPKRGGYTPPADRLRAAFNLIIDINEQMEAEDALPPELQRLGSSALSALMTMLAAGDA